MEVCFDGFGDVQPKSLSPNGAILGNMIRQGEEVIVKEKGAGSEVPPSEAPFKGA